MTAVFSAILYTAAVLIAILLVALVLVQPSKGGGFGAAFGGVGEGVFGAQTMGYLSKITVVLISIFFVVTLVLAALSGHRMKVSSTAESSAAMTTGQTEAKALAPAAVPQKAQAESKASAKADASSEKKAEPAAPQKK